MPRNPDIILRELGQVRAELAAAQATAAAIVDPIVAKREELVREARAAKVSQAAVAAGTGLCQSRVSQIERGTRR